MKKTAIMLSLILAVIMALSGCGFTRTPSDDGTGSGTGIGSGTGSGEGSGTDDGSDDNDDDDEKDDFKIEIGDENAPTFYYTPDGDLSGDDSDKNLTLGKLTATDDYNRSFGYTDGFDEDKYVCLFYFTWLGQHASEMTGEYDITKLMSNVSSNVELWTLNTAATPMNQYHYWGEPLYGYYNSLDPWVIRKHVELFISAGIDVLVFDATNGYCYFEVIEQIANVLREYQNDGWRVPKFMFYTNTNSNATVRKLYSGTGNAYANPFERDGFYRSGNFRDLWFCPDGKPQIIAVRSELDSDMLNYFDVWESMWPAETNVTQVSENYLNHGFPWMDWSSSGNGKGEQKLVGQSRGGVVNISVAQHNRAPFSNAVNNHNSMNTAYESENMWGRGYSATGGADHSDDAINSGVNYEEEWQVAIRKNPKYAFVTGWNEWVALKLSGGNAPYQWGTYFVDTVTREYSRDIEMMKGGYADNFYLQTVRNIRDYKGNSGSMDAVSGKSINIKNGLNQWNGVKSVYKDFTVTATDYRHAANRDYVSFSGSTVYKDDSMRNDVREIRVTHDGENIYFLIECVNDIAGKPTAENNNFMNLLIGVEGQNGGFVGDFGYIVNRLSSFSGDCGVERITDDDYKPTGVGSFTLGGKYMQFAIPLSALNIRRGEDFTVSFKVSDNVTDIGDISSYYVSGECAPIGRLAYIYKAKV